MEEETGGLVLFCPGLNPLKIIIGNCPLLMLTPWLVWSVRGRREEERVAPFLVPSPTEGYYPLVIGQTDCSGEALGPGHILGPGA